MYLKLKLVLIQIACLVSLVSGHIYLDWEHKNPAFDPAIYEDALDSELCREQLDYVTRTNNTLLRLSFLESGLRIPRGLLQFNFLDMGNYDQCLGINRDLDDSTIEGKYCMIQGSLDFNFEQVDESMNWAEFDPKLLNEDNLQYLREMNKLSMRLLHQRKGIDVPRSFPGQLASTVLRMAVCVPKPCTAQEGINDLMFNLTRLGFNYNEEFCRINGDKHWVPADYVAIVILSLIGLVTILSTGYDLWHLFYLKTDPKVIKPILRSFSLYTNSKRLTTFSNNPNNLHCVDGIRAISMFWIIVGHSYLTLPPTTNMIDVMDWMLSIRSLWITAAPYGVDTFFFISGLLVVYTTAGKLTSMKLLKRLHLFYLYRILRMFPLLATIVLLQASIFHYVADGPLWDVVAGNTNNCRTYWWTTLLFVQNYVNANEMCISHSWFLAIDMQCYILSPLVLFWVLSGNKKQGWIGVTAGLLTVLIASSIFCFVNQFPRLGIIAVESTGANYQQYFYYNTLTRASPFFVGMLFGYILYIWRGQKPQMPKYLIVILWICSLILALGLIYITHLMKDTTWSTQLVDDVTNSFSRPAWAVVIGWVVFACQSGYGGPINWFLTLDVWKLASRISYAMYLFHYPIQFITQGVARAPIFFSDSVALKAFLSHAVISYGVGFFITLLIDSPFSILFKHLLGEGPKKSKKEVVEKD